MTTVPNVRILVAMGRCVYGLIFSAAFAVGCAAAATPTDVSQNSTGDSPDLAGSTGTIVTNCMDGGSCSTTNPGDCSMGHAVCSGDVQSCVPDVTTQRCYDGPPGTANKGACKAGTQTCIGSLGSCDGEVKPATVENCFNDLDDDCDGAINNGCPNTLTTGTPRLLTAIGDSGSGTAFSLRCPAGQFVSKTQMWGDNNAAVLAITALDVYCATPTLVRGASSYTVTVAVSGTPLSAGTDRPMTPTTTFTCDTASFSPGWQTPGTGANGSGGGIDGLGLYCGSTTLALDA
ncbi:MAG: hypothetical protein JWM53_3643, partial [bacterium]|nr:hypothetical protein [bacterium]